jgi:NAD(P)-dependent dehydrogenase (short-subunit alcohol dehydrogenase family)
VNTKTCSGPVDTPLLARLTTETEGSGRPELKDMVSLRRIGKAEEMAKTICFALSDDASYTTGAVFTVDGSMPR